MSKLNTGSFANPVLVLLGIIAYFVSFHLVRKQFSDFRLRFSQITLKQSVFYAFSFAMLAAIFAGLFFQPDRIAAAKGGFLEMAASIPVLFLNIENHKEVNQVSLKKNRLFIFAVCAAYIVFCLTLGRGVVY